MSTPVPTTAASTTVTTTTTATPSLSRRALLVVATLLLGLVAPMFVSTSSAHAATGMQRRVPLETSIQWSVLRLMNRQRALHHLAPLHMNSRLQLSARRHNAAMARHNTMSHQLRGEADFTRRIDAAGYRWSWAGENIGWNGTQRNRAGVLQLQKLMYNERAPYDGHRRNILSRNFRDVGVDVYFDHVNHKVWLTTDFGTR